MGSWGEKSASADKRGVVSGVLEYSSSLITHHNHPANPKHVAISVLMFILFHIVYYYPEFNMINDSYDVVHWKREWQTTSVFLPWEPNK